MYVDSQISPNDFRLREAIACASSHHDYRVFAIGIIRPSEPESTKTASPVKLMSTRIGRTDKKTNQGSIGRIQGVQG